VWTGELLKLLLKLKRRSVTSQFDVKPDPLKVAVHHSVSSASPRDVRRSPCRCRCSSRQPVAALVLSHATHPAAALLPQNAAAETVDHSLLHAQQVSTAKRPGGDATRRRRTDRRSVC